MAANASWVSGRVRLHWLFVVATASSPFLHCAVQLLKEAVTNLGSDAAAVLHESMHIEFASAAGNNSTDIFERLADFFNKTLSKIVLGRSDAADSTAGQLGGQLITDEVRRDILEGDAEEVQNMLNAQLVKPFIDCFAQAPTLAMLVFAQPELGKRAARQLHAAMATILRTSSNFSHSRLPCAALGS